MTKACTVCSKSFASEQALQAHMNATKHMLVRIFNDNQNHQKPNLNSIVACARKPSREKAYLQQHMSYHVMLHFLSNAAMPEVFPHLGSTTTASERLFSLRWSLWEATAPLGTQTRSRCFLQCSICAQSFNNPEALKQHSKILLQRFL